MTVVSATSSADEQPPASEPSSGAPAGEAPGGRHVAGPAVDEPPFGSTDPDTTRDAGDGTAEPGAAPSSDAPEPSPRDRYLLKLFGPRRLALGSTARDRLWGWLGPLLVTALAAVLRLYHLGYPKTLVFDETYYVKYAYSLLRSGYEAKWPDNPNPAFESGHVDTYLHQADYVVHPPLGKWMISLGLRFGGAENPWAWRISTAIVGIAAVWIVARIARRIFGSTLIGVLAGLFMAVDGEAIVHSRTSLLDNFVMFWGLVAFAFLILDREQARRRLADRCAAIVEAGGEIGKYGPRLGWRWYRFLAAVSLGLMCGTKWSGIYFIAVFGLLTVGWDMTARRAVGVRRWWEDAILVDGIPAALIMLPTALIAYLATWWGWFRNPMSYMRQWAEQNPGEGVSWLPPALRSFWQYHVQMWHFHNTLDTPHPYQANPLGWMLQWRPTSFYYESIQPGQQGCGSAPCSQAVTSLGNPVLWWAGALCLAVALVWLFIAKDWRATAVLAGVVAGWFPWFAYMHRTIFTFYSIVFTPWVMMGVAYVIALLLEETQGERRARRRVVVGVSVFVTVVVAVSLFFYPIWTAQTVPYTFWHLHMWLPSWI
ncbi:phospholipid carrier-dependent glycosyltransferase [Luteimicrobium xylanilyticum]|uniref:Polyprenol-phosphate-mannose--protein mannosyltransferase n=1 Tax=Luteimicrobium xylanilyticum TaxID=1133546 RepID=A0A5P9QD06_9MICO|nr:Dolichyl-phosphate-mannose--protein mannosyltransferase [Luteimicrobium xylanilyticum]